MIKARINSTGEVVEVRPYQTEKYDFMACRNGGIMGELYMRSELTIIGDKELEFVELVKRMREAQQDHHIADMKLRYHQSQDREIPDDVWDSFVYTMDCLVSREDAVDQYLKKMEI